MGRAEKKVARAAAAAVAEAAAVTPKAATSAAGKGSKAAPTKAPAAAAAAAAAPAAASSSKSAGAKSDAEKKDGEHAPHVRPYQRKQKTLLLSSRGITTRFRHLFKDLHKLMPHCRKGAAKLRPVPQQGQPSHPPVPRLPFLAPPRPAPPRPAPPHPAPPRPTLPCLSCPPTGLLTLVLHGCVAYREQDRLEEPAERDQRDRRPVQLQQLHLFRNPQAPRPVHVVLQGAAGPEHEVLRPERSVAGACGAWEGLGLALGVHWRSPPRLTETPPSTLLARPVPIVHTMQELNMTGNALKGARPLLSFDATFESSPHWLLVKEMLTQVRAPPSHPHCAPPPCAFPYR